MGKLIFVRLALVLALLPQLPPAYAQAPHERAAAPAKAAAPPAATIEAARTITAARLSEFLHVVASDATEGRDTPSRGLDETARYIADHLKRWGLKPAGDDGTYFQRIALTRDKVDPAATSFEFNGRALPYGEQFLAGRVAGAASGPLAFVGHGWVLRSRNIDAYKGLDVRDKVVVVAGTGFPAGVERAELRGKPGADWEDPEFAARARGAKGLIVVPRTRDLDRWWRARQHSLQNGTYEVVRFNELGGGGESPQLPTVFASAALLNTLFEGERSGGGEVLRQALAGEPGAPFALAPHKRVKFTVGVKTESAATQNVVAVLEGADPVLKQEYVALGAHYDHVGKDARLTGDQIYNGADDDGSGTVAVLNIAEAAAKGKRPKRSLLFVWHAGEEKGLWGSRYFTQFPTVPLASIVVQLNMDMIGRSKKAGDESPANRALSGAEEIYVIGSKMMSTELGELSERVNASYLNLAFNYRYDDPRDPNRFFFRSDHYNYARRGVPIIFYFDGVHEDYHRPSDTPDKIDYQKMEKVTRTVYATAIALADAPARPRIDRQLPGELTER